MKDLKILCVCRAGVSRSVHIKKVLNDKGYFDVLSVGGLLVPPETLNMLCRWADIILLAKPTHGKNIEEKYQHKIEKEFYFGEDWDTIVLKQLDRIDL